MAVASTIESQLSLTLSQQINASPQRVFDALAGTYQTIDRPTRLVYSWMWEDRKHESKVTYELRPHAGGTEVTLTHEGFADAESQHGHSRGWTACLQQMAELLGAA